MRKKKVEKHTMLSYRPVLVNLLIGIILIAIWTLFIAPEFKKISANFNYSAQILSLDNFYDEHTGKFEGEHISRTQFSYVVEGQTPSYLIIKNTFRVSKLSNTPIFHVNRTYYIDPYSGQHVAINGDKERNGYLFAPRYAPKDNFFYWHINYDAPAPMQYMGKEKIEDLMVYKYQAKYQADQTKELTHLQGVPEKKGVKTDIDLQIWIEPVSGWLIKYFDNTHAYFYDIKTGAKLNPWNTFSNRYTQNSIHDKVIEAKKLKWNILFIDFGVPLLIIVVCLSFSFRKDLMRMFSIRQIWQSNWAMRAALITPAVLFFIASSSFIIEAKKEPKFRIGISYWNNNPELLSALQGFKDGLAENGYYEGINLEFLTDNPESNVEKQISIIQSFLQNNVNLIFTLTTPGTLIAKGITTKIPIVFTDVSYPTATGIIPLHAQIKSNLVGALNYISPADQFYHFELLFPQTSNLGFVYQKGEPDSEIQLQEFKAILAQRNIHLIPIPAIDVTAMKKQIIEKIHKQEINALYFACDTLIRDKGHKVAANLSREYKIPSFSCDKESVSEGILIGYFADLYTTGKLAGYKAALLLQGAETDWVKTETTENGILMINIPTAKLLGITIPYDELDNNLTLIEH